LNSFALPEPATMSRDRYEIVVGLEVHAQLLTKSKLFSAEATAFGAEPNSQVSAITLAHPGTLPRLNEKAVEFAVKMGMACHCIIQQESYFARKNYFYPDLPKGYQISQHHLPLCGEGFVQISLSGQTKRIRISRIHLEEDAGNSLHEMDAHYSFLDFNRAGVPLIEIVSEPDIRSGQEAAAYLTELRKLVRWLDICDGNMEEGSMRCDANVSVRQKGQDGLGTRVEIKNMNSIRNVKRAIEAEALRQYQLTDRGERIIQETRSFDAQTGESFTMRVKEMEDDYRYFPEPDLAPLQLGQTWLEEIRKSIPPLPEELGTRYLDLYGLSPYDARVLTDDRKSSDYFLQLVSHEANPKAAANWVLGPVRGWINEHPGSLFPVTASCLASLIGLVQDNRISFSAASSRILPEMIRQPDVDPLRIAGALDLIQDNDASHIGALVDEVLNSLPEKVLEYHQGKKGLLGLFLGELMKNSGGKADPKLAKQLFLQKLGEKNKRSDTKKN
jgi:aspartyl-tRNA(Asn)/glutamyl-tRNA(Gln) amidotransferase subunit B